jgi:response regulator RpfG family c-di-GMP phosphodiesterase
MSRDEANTEIVRGAGTYFDPDIVRAWLRASDRLECS